MQADHLTIFASVARSVVSSVTSTNFELSSKIALFTPNSSCFLQETYINSKATVKIVDRLGLLDILAEAKPRITIIDAGSGTTGTRGFYRVACSLGLIVAHFGVSCHNESLNDNPIYINPPLSVALRNMRACCNSLPSANPLESEECSVSSVLKKLANALVTTAISFDALCDLPADSFLPELLLLAPRMKVVVTGRNSIEWAKKRVFGHGGDLICVLESQAVRHPFDFIGCLQEAALASMPLQSAFLSLRLFTIIVCFHQLISAPYVICMYIYAQILMSIELKFEQ